MMVALVSLFKEMFIQEALNDVVARITAEAVGDAVSQLIEDVQETSDMKLQVLDIESDTWYVFHLAEEDSWRKGLYQWARIITREVPRQYLYKYSSGGPGSVKVPFICSAQPADRDLLVQIRRLPGATGPISKQDVQSSIVAAARDTLKAYVRCVATEGIRFPDDFERV